MADVRQFRDAYGTTARITYTYGAEYPYQVEVMAPNGHRFMNRTYATYRAARAAITSQGFCWVEVDRVRA